MMQKITYEFISKQSNDPILERKVCRRCGSDFPIFQGDKQMLNKLSPMIGGEKFDLPLPTLCSECRQRRRLMFRNERKIYKRKCDLLGIDTICTQHPDSGLTVYGNKGYFSDQWDPSATGRNFDFSKTFTENLLALKKVAPCQAVDQGDDNQNSEYAQHISSLKNSYMCFASVGGEDLIYCARISNCNKSIDGTSMTISDNVYDSFDIYNSNYVTGSAKIIDSSYVFFSYDIRGSNNVIFSAGVVNGDYIIHNKKVSKEEFKNFMGKLKQQIKTYPGYRKAKEEFQKVKNQFPHKASDITNSDNCYGNSIVNCKNTILGFEATNLEDCRYVTFAKYGKDIMDAHGIYPEANKCYEVVAVGYGSYGCYFSYLPWAGHDMFYSLSGYPVNYIFGCIYAKRIDYSIFNKVYEPKEREKEVKKIIQHMQTTGERGEYLDPIISQYPYNDSIAIEDYPIQKIIANGQEKIINRNGTGTLTIVHPEKPLSDAFLDLGGEEKVSIRWRNQETEINVPEKIAKIAAKDIPENIDDVDDDILQKVIICEASGRPFRLVSAELEFYRKHGLPIPRQHPDLRYQERLVLRPPRTLYIRTCDKCKKETLSVYPQDSDFKVYCESCYNKEIYG